MATGWNLDKVLCGGTAEAFVRKNFPDVDFQSVYGRSVCLVADHYVTYERMPFFKIFKGLFQVSLNQTVVELRPVRGVGDTPEQSARDALMQIFEYDFEEDNIGRGRLVRFRPEGHSARPVAGKKYCIFKDSGDDSVNSAARSCASVAPVNNSVHTMIGLQSYICHMPNDHQNYDSGYIMCESEALFLVPYEG